MYFFCQLPSFIIQAVVTCMKMTCLSLNSGSKCSYHIDKSSKIISWNCCFSPPRGCGSQHFQPHAVNINSKHRNRLDAAAMHSHQLHLEYKDLWTKYSNNLLIKFVWMFSWLIYCVVETKYFSLNVNGPTPMFLLI